jgi:hypothetical protein
MVFPSPIVNATLVRGRSLHNENISPPGSSLRYLILRSGVFAASRRIAANARGASFETPRKRAAPQDEDLRVGWHARETRMRLTVL